MLYEIKSLGGSVLYSCESGSLNQCIEVAVKNGANLSCANLSGANLCGAKLYGADLCGANLHGAYLCGANLSCANLSCANLSGANLCGANLCGADLCGANLHGANLRGAKLRSANLSGANLCGADLCGAKLNWQSHALLSHLLKREAGNDLDRRSAAGIIAVSTDWCWDHFLSMDHPAKEWALETLAGYIVDGDRHHTALDEYRKAE